MPAPTLYSYSPANGELLGLAEADRSPADKEEVWLWPGHTTDIVPPPAGGREVAVFRDGAWSVVPDRRGEVWYDREGREVPVDRPGDPFVSGLTEEAPSRPPGPVIIPYATFRARWEPAELAALHEARKADWRVDDYASLAIAQNAVNLSGETAAAASALLVALGVLTEGRAAAIFTA